MLFAQIRQCAVRASGVPAEADASQDAAIEASLDEYADALQQTYVSQPAPSSSSLRGLIKPRALPSNTQAAAERVAQEAVGSLAQSFQDEGPVTNATVVIDLLSSKKNADGTVTVQADIHTTVPDGIDEDGEPIISSWSDTHEIVLRSVRGNFVIQSDKNLPVDADLSLVSDSVIKSKAMSDMAPAPSSAAPPQKFARQTKNLKTVPAPVSNAAILDADELRTNVASGKEIATVQPAAQNTIQAKATAGFPQQTAIKPKKFAEYAVKYTNYPYYGNEERHFNPKYPYYGNNCANFASQVLDNGGWYLTGGNSLQQNDNTKWTFNLAGYKGATRTWFKAAYLAIFANNTGTYAHRANIWNSNKGDLLFTDWDPNLRADGTIDHVMVVTGKASDGMPLIAQKSNNRASIRLNKLIEIAESQGRKNIVWYAMRNI